MILAREFRHLAQQLWRVFSPILCPKNAITPTWALKSNSEALAFLFEMKSLIGQGLPFFYLDKKDRTSTWIIEGNAPRVNLLLQILVRANYSLVRHANPSLVIPFGILEIQKQLKNILQR